MFEEGPMRGHVRVMVEPLIGPIWYWSVEYPTAPIFDRSGLRLSFKKALDSSQKALERIREWEEN